jgi:hypothetical protein
MRTRAHLPESAALWRYIGVWLGGSAAVVAALALALDGGGRAHPEKLELAAERASCRFVRDSDRPAGGSVVVTYRPTLSGAEIARVRDVARRLTAPAAAAASASEAVAAENGVERLGCPRVDALAEDAITLFVLASELDE